MNHDRLIMISAAGSRKATRWPTQSLMGSELAERLKTPVRGSETLEQYLSLPRARQDELKDVGGFVAGAIAGGGRRKASAIQGRDVVTLDLDNIPAGGTQDVLRRVDGLGCWYCVYSTRKHEEAAPRLRVMALLDRTVTADEYEPIARMLAKHIGMELCDPSTFEASRLMYWPSCCADSQYIYVVGDKPMLSADGMLGLYTDWRNVAEWPEVPGAQQARAKHAEKQADPLTKAGIVGAFCRVYDIYRAMDTFLPGVYEPTDTPGRYTFTGGSTTGGAVIYDNGLFLYSHHATDPCSGKLVNSFDLVRLHKFAELDDDTKPDTPVNKLPSYAAMCELAVSDPQVTTLLNQERYQRATEAFETPVDHDPNWMSKLAISATTGAPAKTANNVLVVLENDPQLKGRVAMDTFSEAIVGTAPLPWEPRSKEAGRFRWTDDDDAGLRMYMERFLGFRAREAVQDALVQAAARNQFNPVVEYLQALQWDGTPRLDTLYIDYLGAEEHPYTRAVTRKAFVAAVARAMHPGIKFDTMTVICGRQGIGKSTLFARMGLQWFSDSIKTFEGKEAAELLQGVWIVEMGELEAYSKTDVRAVKSFLSKCDDQYRAAYARKTEKHLRRCVFFGTTNDHDYLKDTTGNRRFWPVDAEVQPPTRSIFRDVDEATVGQIWAEAVMRWQLGEPLYLPPELEAEAERRREQHLDRDPLQGQIEDFLDRPVPEDWQNWDIQRRRMFWSDPRAGNSLNLAPRDRVCAMEIWRECLGDPRTMSKADAHRINAILEALPDWERVSTARFGPEYGTQKGFRRCKPKAKSQAKIVNFGLQDGLHLCKPSKPKNDESLQDGLR
ncbi:MAG: VapE domain-containing protein [Bacillota bacterium]